MLHDLKNLHNDFHHGSSVQLVEMLQQVPLEEAHFVTYRDSKFIKSDDAGYEKAWWAWIQVNYPGKYRSWKQCYRSA